EHVSFSYPVKDIRDFHDVNVSDNLLQTGLASGYGNSGKFRQLLDFSDSDSDFMKHHVKPSMNHRQLVTNLRICYRDILFFLSLFRFAICSLNSFNKYNKGGFVQAPSLLYQTAKY